MKRLRQVGERAGAVMALLAFNMAFFRQAYFTRAILHGSGTDVVSYQQPVMDFVRGELLAGRFPHVLPHVFGGQPLHAVGQAGITYPPNWLLMLPGTFAWIKLSVALHVLLASVLTFFLADRLVRSLGPAAGAGAGGTQTVGGVVAGLAYAYGGFFILHAYAGHVNLLAAASWMPGLWLALWHAGAGAESSRADRKGVWAWAEALRPAVPAAVVLGLMVLCGSPQVVLLGGLVGIFWFLVPWLSRLWKARAAERFGVLAAGMARGALAAVGGLGLSAVQLLPMIEVAGESARVSAQGSEALAYSLPLSGLWNVLFPWFWGHAAQGWWVNLSRWEFAGYVGLGPLLLALIAALRTGRGAILMLGAAVCLTAALGGNGFLYGVLANGVPMLEDFRVPARFLLPASLLLAVGAGLGAALLWGGCSRSPDARGQEAPQAKGRSDKGQSDKGQSDKGRSDKGQSERGRWGRFSASSLGVLLASAPAAVVWWLALRVKLGSMPGFLTRYVESMGGPAAGATAAEWLGAGFLLEAVVGTLVVLCMAARAHRAAGWIAAASVAVSMAMAGSGLLAGGSPGLYRLPDGAEALLERIPDGERVLHYEQRGWNRLYRVGLENIGGYEPALSARMNRLANVVTFGDKGVDARKVWALWPTEASARPSPALSFAAVGYAVVKRAAPFLRGGWMEVPDGSGAKASGTDRGSGYAGGGYRLLHDPKAAPMAFCPVRIASVASPEEAARFLVASGEDPRRTAVLESGSGPNRDSGSCRLGLMGEAPGIVGYRVENEAPAVFVVAQQPGAGWQCEVDGIRAPVLAANLVSSACLVPPGRHEVLVRLVPVTFFVGEALSVSTAVLLAVLAGALWYRRRRETCAT